MTNLYKNQISVEAEYAISFEGMQGTILISDICVNVGG